MDRRTRSPKSNPRESLAMVEEIVNRQTDELGQRCFRSLSQHAFQEGQGLSQTSSVGRLGRDSSKEGERQSGVLALHYC